MTERRHCKGTSKAGTPCKAHPLRDGDYCLAHDVEARESARFGGAQPGAGRKPNPRVVDVLRERIEGRIEEWLKPLDDALTATRPVLVGSGEDAFLVDVADHAIRLRAFAEAMDRSYGKPRQAVEHSGADGGPILTAPVALDADHADETLRILRGARAVNGNGSNGHH